jgi:hypothetical protein
LLIFTCTIPVAFHWFWIESHDDAEFFSDAPQDVTGNPEIIGSLHSEGWSDLVFPLSWHDFSVGSSELNASVEASQSVCFNDVTADDLFSSGSAVVWTLWSWEAICWPTQWTSIDVEECVFLEKPATSIF